jgi:hypothetical protein
MLAKEWPALGTSSRGLLLNVFFAAFGTYRDHGVMSTECGKCVAPCLVMHAFHEIECPLIYKARDSIMARSDAASP